MKLPSLALLLMASVAFVLLGCSDNSSSLVTPNHQPDVASGAPTGLAKGPVARSVTGNGNVWNDGRMFLTTINGHLYADGSVNGEYVLLNTHDNPTKLLGDWPKPHMQGRVVSLTFYENYSFSNGVSGPTALFWWRESKLDWFEGKYFASFFVDVGQGKEDWVGANIGPYDNVISVTPQDIADAWPDYFVPLDVGNVVIH